MTASSGRYQSRLFNFVHKQSRRLTKQCESAFRRLQASTNWVAAVGYPLLLLFQSTRSAAKQLHSSVQRGFPLLSSADTQPQTPPTVDTPIVQVLQLVDTLSSEETNSTPFEDKPEPFKNIFAFFAPWRFDLGVRSQESGGWSQESELCQHPFATLATNSPLIQGIATQLSSQTLVLVTAQNEILDILTSQQQQKLETEIIAAVAYYWHYRMQGEKRAGGAEEAGGAEGEILLTTNRALFSHYSLLTTHSPTTLYQLPPSKIALATPPVLAFIDRTVAEVESNHLAVLSKEAIALFSLVSQSSRQIVTRVQSRVSTSLSKGTNAIAPSADSATQTMRIQTLIRAAIDYFFGTHPQTIEHNQPQNKSISGNLSQNLPKPPQPRNTAFSNFKLTGRSALKLSSSELFSSRKQAGTRSQNPKIEDPWLCESDLFGNSVVIDEITESQKGRLNNMMPGTKKTSALPSRRSNYFLGKLVNIREFFLPAKPASKIVPQQKINSGKVVESTKSPQLRSPGLDTVVEISTSFSTQSTAIEPNPDWIETNATVMGYVKHPLEQLLAWLDGAMLWLEEMLLKVWNWLRLLRTSG